ncbi:MAG: pyridoxamine 5'-phosphate oxidase family protein [Prosthecobacter sp.]|nr:pyridoxamine 5'-phosphate oxidase family protein [Prosthecobacter sp.]
MATKFLDLAFTPAVQSAQEHYYGRHQVLPENPPADELTPEEISFIETRDSFYMSSVSETVWPYVQHRGGPAGFCKVIGPNQLAFADYRGNRQMLSTGNFASNDRVCLFMMDYAAKERLKLLGHCEVLDARDHPDLVQQLTTPETARLTERIYRIQVVGYDWNCPKYITPRYTAVKVNEIVGSLRARISELETHLSEHS